MSAISWPFGDLKPLWYDFIMIDPPWSFDLYSPAGAAKSAAAHYSTMSLDQIAALPVSQLAAPDTIVFCWATHALIHRQIEVVEAWGFRFSTTGVWVKRTKTGKLGFGTGYTLRVASEPFIIGRIGRPRHRKSMRTVIEGPLREHSRKPDEAYAECEKFMPDARRADLFSRESRSGWSSWGDEAGKFD